MLELLAFGDRGADPGLGRESGNARAPCAAALGERALRTECDLQFAGQILPLELLVLADIGGDHLPDLPGAEQLAQPLAVDAGVVARDGEVLDPRIADRVDQPLRSEEHTSELQSLMRISYAVFCLKKKKQQTHCRTTRQ